jgi:hypothetical protein
MLSRLDEEYVLRQLCRRAGGARTRTFTVSARGLGLDRNGVLAKVLRRLEAASGVSIIVTRLVGRKKAKYVVDAAALRQVCVGLC